MVTLKKYPICDCSRFNQMPYDAQKQRLLLTCEPISELPSNIITMIPAIRDLPPSQKNIMTGKKMLRRIIAQNVLSMVTQ